MGNKAHSTLTTTDLHVPGYQQASDPGAVGPGIYWIDTNISDNWILKIRNDSDDGWEQLSNLTNIPDSSLQQIVTASKVHGSSLTGLASVPAGAGILPAVNLPPWKLLVDTTVSFTSGMTIAAMQALIDAQPKDLGSKTLTFQFGDGTYTFSDTLTFTGFYGGTIEISGKTSEDEYVKHQTQAVILNATTSTSLLVLNVHDCFCSVRITNIKTISPTSTNSYKGIYCYGITGSVSIYGCYCLGSSAVYGYSIYAEECPNTVVGYCYVSTAAYGITAVTNTSLRSISNASLTTYPSYGLLASAAIIRKDGDQPSGTIGATLTNVGGSIV